MVDYAKRKWNLELAPADAVGCLPEQRTFNLFLPSLT
jgi:hypothetical protein